MEVNDEEGLATTRELDPDATIRVDSAVTTELVPNDAGQVEAKGTRDDSDDSLEVITVVVMVLITEE